MKYTRVSVPLIHPRNVVQLAINSNHYQGLSTTCSYVAVDQVLDLCLSISDARSLKIIMMTPTCPQIGKCVIMPTSNLHLDGMYEARCITHASNLNAGCQ